MIVGRPGPASNEPSTTGLPPGARCSSARPPRARSVAAPSSAQRSTSGLCAGSAETLGTSTKSFSMSSKRSRSLAAKWSSSWRLKAITPLLGYESSCHAQLCPGMAQTAQDATIDTSSGRA